MTNNVSEWLLHLGLGKYAEAFAENDVEFEVLSELTDDDLRLDSTCRLNDLSRVTRTRNVGRSL